MKGLISALALALVLVSAVVAYGASVAPAVQHSDGPIHGGGDGGGDGTRCSK